MSIGGRCYCGELQYTVEGDPIMKAQCHCRECQYMSGGNASVVMAMPEAGFSYTSGKPAEFTRDDIEGPVTREFCSKCGTQIASRAPGLPGAVLLKVGTLDDPSVYGGPDMAIFTCDAQSFHHVPDGVPSFEKVPG